MPCKLQLVLVGCKETGTESMSQEGICSACLVAMRAPVHAAMLLFSCPLKQMRGSGHVKELHVSMHAVVVPCDCRISFSLLQAFPAT